MEDLKLCIRSYVESILFLSPNKVAITQQNLAWLSCRVEQAFSNELKGRRVELLQDRYDLVVNIVEPYDSYIQPIWRKEDSNE